ncbi:MAG: cytochrome c oxidase assembly factor Coa1 family protein [Arenimonas sp.]
MNYQVTQGWLSRNWKWFVPVICFLGLLAICGFVGLLFYSVTSMMKSTDAYQMAVQQAKSNPEVVSAIGKPIAEGLFTTGNINTSGSSGTADMAIPISGPKGEAKIYVTAKQSVGKWTFNNLVVEIDKTHERIDLLQEQEQP